VQFPARDAASPKNALLIVCGQHWQQSAISVAGNTTARFLLLTGVFDEADFNGVRFRIFMPASNTVSP
jgi:hypothetical protein